ncbi:hypothetical protein CSIM01_11800 [Colletotrichum simmondsii]|uniref:Uncharacterized protein n=1 Tax=Colletotrichum simmondsii TaxID=703756 RepID=A0A135SFA4_9PEZI|nr:hypothetical protein CSIM01_11800 [Colletotrichum simmondsii]
MRFLVTITLAILTAGVTAVPVAVLPSLVHPPVHVFRADPAAEAADAEPNIEARGENIVDVSDWQQEPEIQARDEAAIDAWDLEPQTQPQDSPHIQARDEAALDNGNLETDIEAREEPQIKARDEAALDNYDLEPEVQLSDKPQIKARDEAALPDNFDLKPEIHARDEPHIQARSEAKVAWTDPDYHAGGVTAADDWKYRDNLAKLDANNCGVDCHRSINSYRSRVSREHRPYYDRNTDYHSNNYDHHDYNYGVQRSSRASRGEHNTPADDWKYRDNLVKQDNHDCGSGCKHSLASYRSVASKDSRIAREKDYHNYNHQDDKYNNWHPKDYHVNGNGYNHNNGHYDDRTIRTNTYYPKDHHPTNYNDIHHNDYHGNNYHTNGNGYDHHNNGHDYGVQRSSRASRGEHNTPQDVIKHNNNHYKLDHNNCGVNCHKSLASYHSVAAADSRRSRQSRQSHGNHGH